MATAQIISRYRGEYTETYSSNFLTAVGGTTTDVTIDLPAGWYYGIEVYGQQTNSGTASTLLLYRYNDAAQTAAKSTPFTGDKISSVTPGISPVDLGVSQGVRTYHLGRDQNTVGSSSDPTYIPHGIRALYTKNAATAVDLTLVTRRVG